MEVRKIGSFRIEVSISPNHPTAVSLRLVRERREKQRYTSGSLHPENLFSILKRQYKTIAAVEMTVSLTIPVHWHHRSAAWN